MELPCRATGDELLQTGEFSALCARLRKLSTTNDLVSVVASAFDHRTRMLPFFFADTRMAPAGVRAIASALIFAGFPRTRIVLQQWNRHFRPSKMKLDSRMPDIFLVSGMAIHSEPMKALIRDACSMPLCDRPLIVAGGPKVIYEPWDVFGADPDEAWGADVAVTGEEFVLLRLLEAVISWRVGREPLRQAFMRAKEHGALDPIEGLVYPRGGRNGVPEELVDTGIQRLLGNLDELPDPVSGYGVLEPPSRRETLASAPLAAGLVSRHSPIGSLVLTAGCRFSCAYCPVPAYNQRQYRAKSPERIAREMERLHGHYGLRYFFGADDNFFNDAERALDIVQRLAHTEICGVKLHRRIMWGTEATVHDTLRMSDHLALVRKSGLAALWMGVEDMTATFVRKGQSVGRTQEAFALLRRYRILPMPMLMHHDSQPLYSRGDAYGLINQARLLRKAGATTLQVLMATPAAGSKAYEGAFDSGLVFHSAGGRQVRPHMLDGNYVVASGARSPWRNQANLILAYLYFYNPLRLAGAFLRRGDRMRYADAALQLLGMAGLLRTIMRTSGWMLRLLRGRIRLRVAAPSSAIPMRSADGGHASHALPEASSTARNIAETCRSRRAAEKTAPVA